MKTCITDQKPRYSSKQESESSESRSERPVPARYYSSRAGFNGVVLTGTKSIKHLRQNWKVFHPVGSEPTRLFLLGRSSICWLRLPRYFRSPCPLIHSIKSSGQSATGLVLLQRIPNPCPMPA